MTVVKGKPSLLGRHRQTEPEKHKAGRVGVLTIAHVVCSALEHLAQLCTMILGSHRNASVTTVPTGKNSDPFRGLELFGRAGAGDLEPLLSAQASPGARSRSSSQPFQTFCAFFAWVEEPQILQSRPALRPSLVRC